MAVLAAVPLIEAISAGASIIGGVVSAVGSIQQGQAAKQSADYNAKVASANAQQAKNNATMAANAGEEQAAIQSQKTKAAVGSTLANQAAGGIDVNSGSAVDVRSSEADLGQLDALTIRSNAAKEAYGYQTQASNFTAQSGLDTAEGKNAQATGNLGAISTFLGSAGSAATNFAKFQMAGGLNAGSSVDNGDLFSTGNADESSF